jgi:hypothetical protein
MDSTLVLRYCRTYGDAVPASQAVAGENALAVSQGFALKSKINNYSQTELSL